MSVVINIMEKLRQEAEISLENKLCRTTRTTQCIIAYGEHEGIELALRLAGIRSGMSIVCPALGDPVLLGAVRQLGALPIFCDVSPDSWTIDCAALKGLLARLERSKKSFPQAVIASDIFGLPCNLPAIKELCGNYKIALIEDSRHCLGVEIGREACGSFGDVAITLLNRDPEIAVIFCDFAPPELYIKQSSFAPLSLVDLSLSSHRLPLLTREISRREILAGFYHESLSNVQFQRVPTGFSHSYFGFGVLFASEAARNHARESLSANRIDCNKTPLLLHKLAGRMHALAKMPNAEQIASRLLALPMHEWLNKKTIYSINFKNDSVLSLHTGAKDAT